MEQHSQCKDERKSLRPSELTEIRERLALAIAAVDDTLSVFERHPVDELKSHEYIRYARIVGALHGLTYAAGRGGRRS